MNTSFSNPCECSLMQVDNPLRIREMYDRCFWSRTSVLVLYTWQEHQKKPARGLGTNDFIISQDIAHEENKDKTLDRIIIPTKKCCWLRQSRVVSCHVNYTTIVYLFPFFLFFLLLLKKMVSYKKTKKV